MCVCRWGLGLGYGSQMDLKVISCHFSSLSDLRLEDMVNQKLERKARERNTNVEALGYSMVDAGNELGPGTQYGKCSLTVS